MDLEQNKRLVSEFFARFSRSDIAGALHAMTDDATWRVPGKAELMPAAGDYDKERLGRLFHRMVGRLKDGLTMTVKGLVAEGDKVAVEVVSHGELVNGRVYDQEYHFLMTVRDGKISAVREYLDTQHAFAVWVQP